ncbi:hypothetical protein K431DRAFT_232261 [Polychaeton citri CBS 116435]|uniref:DUF2470 domain-containing protein n=1 Tax=Polychaeton citri CBS 116435 TaxID=1314669 RepID=A0A9P4Q453_9PEZI|nr:hypothetical protein K431DRAFT_232261 [Polychaeton citri CBS 116435]
MAAGRDADAKQRIINHMNTDHHDSVMRYLEYYCNVDTWTAAIYNLSDINEREMVFRPKSQLAGGSNKPYHVPFSPVLGSLKEVRERVVAMDDMCITALGRSSITIKEYVPPTGLYAIEFAIIAGTFLAYSQRWWFAAGGPVEQLLGAGFAKFSWAIQPWLFAFMVVLHAAESGWLVWSRLGKHSVNPRSKVFWQWTIGHFIEGFFSFHRFDQLVATKRAEKDAKKH